MDKETQELLAAVDAIAEARGMGFIECLTWIVETAEGRRAFEARQEFAEAA